MKIYKGYNRVPVLKRGSIAAIGVFDGVHAGHRRIISGIVKESCLTGLDSVLVTFDPHPAKILKGCYEAPSLISLKHRIRLVEELGVDIGIVINFTDSLSMMSPEAFVKNILIDRLNVRSIYVGDSFYFGKGAKAGVEELKALSRRFGFKVNVVRSLKRSGHVISSSLIRRLIVSGRIDRASELLGRRVSVLGTVVGGAELARELGYPTANLNPHHEVIPPSGVYAVKVRYNGRMFNGVLNIGVRPTFYAPRDQEPSIEVHIFNFTKKIYNKDIEVYFVKKIRKEMKFISASMLAGQIKKDIISVKKILTCT